MGEIDILSSHNVVNSLFSFCIKMTVRVVSASRRQQLITKHKWKDLCSAGGNQMEREKLTTYHCMLISVPLSHFVCKRLSKWYPFQGGNSWSRNTNERIFVAQEATKWRGRNWHPIITWWQAFGTEAQPPSWMALLAVETNHNVSVQF